MFNTIITRIAYSSIGNMKGMNPTILRCIFITYCPRCIFAAVIHQQQFYFITHILGYDTINTTMQIRFYVVYRNNN